MTRWSVEIVAVVALLLRLAIVLLVGFNIDYFDVDGYHSGAITGMSGHPVPSEIHGPGYSWTLMVLYEIAGPRPRIAYVAQAILSALCVFLIGDAARRRWGARAGTVAALLLAVDGYLCIFASVLASETLSLFGVSLFAWLILPRLGKSATGAILASALVCGMLALVRTGYLLFALVPCMLLILDVARPRIRRIALAGAVLLIAVSLPAWYAAERAEHTGAFRLGSAWDSRNLWIGNNPYSVGRIDHMPDEPPLGVPGAENEFARAHVFWDRAIAFALDDPRSEVELIFARMSFLAAPAKRDLIYVYAHGWAGERSPSVVWFAYWWVVAAVPMLVIPAILALARGRDDAAWWCAIAIIGIGALPYLASIGDARYMQPFHGVLAFAAAAAVREGAQLHHRSWRLPAAVVLATAFAANTAYDLWKTDPAIRAIAAPGGSKLNVPYHFAR